VFSRTVLVCIAAALAGVAAGCGSSDATAPARTQVVAAFYPLAYAAEQVAGRAVDVTNLTPSGAEPHDIELSPRDVERIDGADVVLYVGSGFMPQVEDAVARPGNGLDVLTEVETVSGPSGVDPHVWLDPLRYAAVVRRIAGELGDPAAGARLSARLEQLDRDFRTGLSRCRRSEIVTSHAAFGYLAEAYGLEQVALAGLTPEAEPSARALASLVDDVRRLGATTVFVEPLVSPTVAETVAREAGVKVAPLDPIEGIGEGELGRGADYFSVMRGNLRALRDALGCA
jgi:zinc transport system substrate-binding protein